MGQDPDSDAAIAVHRPLLPDADMLLPYLRRVDQARVYSNFGPLAQLLSERLCAHFGAPKGGVHPTSSATSALTATLMHLCPQGGLCAMPAWTFAATAHAVLNAGLTPFLVDVDAQSQQIHPQAATAAIAAAPGPIRAVVAVAPFGAPVEQARWLEFRDRTGIAVVIDAAAAFDSVQVGDVPAVISLHATKAFAAGEGGLILCTDQDLVAGAALRANFGFWGSRNAAQPGINGKLSEYHAAVALASLDAWPQIRRDFMTVQHRLAASVSAVPAIKTAPGCGRDWTASVFCVELDADCTAIADDLAARGIETRRWWGDGIQAHAAFAGLAAMDLSNTRSLARRVLGLPCSRDMTEGQIQRVGAGLARALGIAAA